MSRIRFHFSYISVANLKQDIPLVQILPLKELDGRVH